LARLCRSNKCVFVVGIYDARVLSDIRYFQKRLAAFVGRLAEFDNSGICRFYNIASFALACAKRFGVRQLDAALDLALSTKAAPRRRTPKRASPGSGVAEK